MANWFAAVPVELPEDVLRELKRDAPPGLRWFAREDLHLTVAFFKTYREERLEAVKAAMAGIPKPEFDVKLGQLVPLPSPRRFSALSFSMTEGAAALKAWLQAHHAPLMAAAGMLADPREALPHFTIARPNRRATHAERHAILDWAATVEPPALTLHLDRLALYGWAEDRTLRQFRILWEG